jgi:hypothetical protein
MDGQNPSPQARHEDEVAATEINIVLLPRKPDFLKDERVVFKSA